jgi:hypothetical protein
MSRGAAVQAFRIRSKFCARRWIAYSAGCPQMRDEGYWAERLSEMGVIIGQ